MEAWVKLKPWQAEFVVLVDSRTLITASSDAYLEQILKGMKADPEGRALPANLPEWKYVDPSVKAWLLRRLPERNEQIQGMWPGRDRQFRGLVWMADPRAERGR